MPRKLALLFLLLGFVAPAFAANYPFPQNQAQPFATNYPAYNNADITAAYNSWKAQQVTAAGAGGFRRVQRNGDVTLQANSTVSEGIAYGMIIAVYMDDQALFDDLWRYHNLHLDGNGLMHWYISADGNTVLGAGAASDADQDIAWALVMANYQWGGSGALAQTYMTYAQDMIAKIWTHEVEKPSMVFRNGDGWGGAATLNVSYFDPSMYRVFAQVSGNTGWYDVVDTCYTALFNSLNATNGNQTNGLVPAWSNLAGQPVVAYAGAPTHFQYDSCRTPFRIAKDWIFFGEPRARSYTAMISAFYNSIGAANITDGYDLNGAERPQYDTLGNGDTGQSAVFVGAGMVGAMTQAGLGPFVQQAYDRVKTNTLMIGGPYYEQSWTVMSLLMASGNYLNYVPTPVPTPTPDACQFRVRVNAGGAAQSGFNADQVYSAGSYGYEAAYAGSVGTSGGPITGSSTPGLYLDERYANAGGEVRYSLTVPNGAASVTLHWAETYYNAAGQRRMDVHIEGVLVENDLDLYAASGSQNQALARTYATTVSGGVLNLRFVSVIGEASIHAIDVTAGPLCSPTVSPTRTPNWTATASPSRTPSPSQSPTFSTSPSRSASPTISPTFTALPTPDACTVVRRINSGGGAFIDSQGLAWAADQAYSAGSYGYVSFAAGTLGTSAGPIANTVDDSLYMNERYGNPVRYRFDVANGAYRVRVLLAETYFATAGQRSISLSANGTTVLNNVDLFTQAGGLNRAWELTFTATAAGGQLFLEAWSSNNSATFMGIELVSVAGCTPTVTRTRTLGAPPTDTSTVTPSSTPSFSSTRTPSASSTATISASASSTATPSASSSTTPSRSATPSQTASVSVTGSPTLSVSATFSASGTPGTSASLTASSTPQGSPSSTATPSVTVTQTRSDTGTPTGTSPLTGSSTATVSVTGSRTLTPSATPSHTAAVSSSTPSRTTTAATSSSPSSTPSTTASLSSTPSTTASSSSTPSTTAASVTLTLTPSASASGTVAASASRTPTATSTATATPSATPGVILSPPQTLGSSGQPLQILALLPLPNPNPTGLAVLAQGGPGDVDVKLYSSAMTCVGRAQLRVGAGWSQHLGVLGLAGLSNGVYFVEMSMPGSKGSGSRLCKLTVLR